MTPLPRAGDYAVITRPADRNLCGASDYGVITRLS